MMPRHWIAVASAEHVARGRAEGFMQLCHGKAAPLRRIAPADGVIYYSPTHTFRGKDRLQSFTSIGIVAAGEPYQVNLVEGFSPWRRDVLWQRSRQTPIAPLLGRLNVTRGQRNWGYRFRFGLLEISAADYRLIEDLMGSQNSAQSPTEPRLHQNAMWE